MNKLFFSWPQKNRALPVICVCVGQVIWGFSYLFTRIAQNSASPTVVLSMRFLASWVIMTALIWSGKKSFSLKGKNFRPLLALALLEPPYYFFESYGVYYSNATFAGTVMAFAPVVGILAAMLFLGEKPTRRRWSPAVRGGKRSLSARWLSGKWASGSGSGRCCPFYPHPKS